MKNNLNSYATFPGYSITPYCTPVPFHYNHTLPAERVCPLGIILKHWQRADFYNDIYDSLTAKFLCAEVKVCHLIQWKDDFIHQIPAVIAQTQKAL